MTTKEIRAAHRAWQRLKRELAKLVTAGTPTRIPWGPGDWIIEGNESGTIEIATFRTSIPVSAFRSIYA